MEAATVEQTPDEKDATAVATDPATQAPERLFRYSTWVHVGPHAESCESVNEEKGTCECSDPLHFHAWVRLPNQFQHREVREKALAAKARRARQLRDPDADAHAILEDELDQLARGGDLAKQGIIEDLIQRDGWKETLEAAKDLEEEEDERGDKLYEHIRRDRDRLYELRQMPEDEVPTEELAELERHVGKYNDALDSRIEERLRPQREALDARELHELIEMVRDDRIESDAMEEFTHTYNTWMWLVGTLRQPRGERSFTSIEQMREAAPEVLMAIQAAYGDLEVTHQKEAQGNS